MGHAARHDEHCAAENDLREPMMDDVLSTARQSSGRQISSADRFGPFADGIDAAERLARLRSMRAIVNLATGPRGEALARELYRAERDPARLPAAVAALDALAALDRRHVLASFARLHRTD